MLLADTVQSFDQVEIFSSRSSMAVSWFSDYLSLHAELPINPQPLFCRHPAEGQIRWRRAGFGLLPALNRRCELSAQLAEFLLEDSFLGRWTFETGYLPPHGGALRNWQDAQMRPLLDQIQASARLLPPTEVLDRLGPLLEQATVDVLKEQSDPTSAARTAIENLKTP
jgi:hypothetical protein